MTEATDLLRRLFFYQAAYHAEQWRARDGRTGYSPACEQRFSDACKARGFRCEGCPERSPTPLTDERLAQHLKGKITLGAYQLRADSGGAGAGWLCIDVDADEDTNQARANVKRLTELVVATSRRMGLPCHVEYTGNKGFHVWWFVPDGAPAGSLRRLGRWIVDTIAEEEGDLAGIHAEVFPKQDTLDGRDVYGNLVKVPLGRHRKTNRRCLFVDAGWKPYPDQVAYLREAETITPEALAEALEEWVPEEDPPPPARSNGHGAAPSTGDAFHHADNVAQAARNLERLAPRRADDYDTWLEVGMALSELGDIGLAMWDRWSHQSAKYQEGACASKWTSFEPHHGRTLASLVHWAREDSGGAATSRPNPAAAPPNLTDLGNAQRLVAMYGTDLRFSHPARTWYVWDGRRWAQDYTGEVMRRAKETAREIYREAADCLDDERRRQVARWAEKSESEGRLTAMIALAESEPGLPVLPAQLDANPWVLNVLNGTLDLHTGELYPHRREDLITKLAPVEYDPTARHEVWERYLDDATHGDPAMQRFLAQAVGYSLVGAPSEEKLFFIHGPAAAGKSTLIEAIKAILGEYAATADFETFLKRTNVNGSPRNDIARLAGARFVCSIEVEEGKKLAEGLVKTITGGDTVTARHLYREAFEFVPQFTLWLVANHAPRVNDEDDAMWRRILRVPFERVVPEADRDPRVKATLRDPAVAGPAILAWAVRGCLDWLANGLVVPQAVAAATDAYRTAQDPLADFVHDRCVVSPVAHVPAGALRAAYEEWCKEGGHRPLSGRVFAERMKNKGFESSARIRIQGKITRCWVGIGLQAEDDPDDEQLPLGANAYGGDERAPF